MNHLLLAMLIASTPALAVPAALITDPPASAAYPADLMSLLIASHGANLNGRIYLAEGAGPHPTMLLLHGFPGVEQSTDIAQAVRRAGWNVVLFHYRGAWGSQGDFSFGHSIEDSQVVLDWIRNPANLERYRIDPKRIVVAGHSMGGFMAVETAVANPGLAGVILIDPWNPGADAARMAAVPADYREKATQSALTAIAANLPPLAGASAPALLAELKANALRWNTVNDAAALAKSPLLLFGATGGNGDSKGIGADNVVLGDAIAAVPGARLTRYDWKTDHYFNDKRVALTSSILGWLQALPR